MVDGSGGDAVERSQSGTGISPPDNRRRLSHNRERTSKKRSYRDAIEIIGRVLFFIPTGASMKLNQKSMSKLVDLHSKDTDRDGMEPVFLRTQAGGLTRSDVWQGRDYFVVQTVAVISKVLNRELLPADEVFLFAEAWNGRPIPLRHPQVNGFYVSANSPSVMEEFNLGFFFNARAEKHKLGAKLVGEMWLDVALIEAKGGVALNALQTLRNGGTVEVSTAYFCLVRDEEGEYAGEPYRGVQYNVKPDHVALLPDEVGACSVADGCGVNANSSEAGEDAGEPESALSVNLGPGQRVTIGIFLEPSVAATLGIQEEGLEPVEDLHITLAYLGEGEEVSISQQEAAGIVDYLSSQLYAHTVQVSGSFRFYGEDGDAVGYLVDGESLDMTRRILVQELAYDGQEVSRPGHWVPHITLGYTSDDGLQIPEPGVNRFGVQALSLAYGDDLIRFPFRGELGQVYNYRKEVESMSNEEKVPCTGRTPATNDAATEANPADDNVTESQPVEYVIPEELRSFMDQVEAAGGIGAIQEALSQITASNEAKRNGAIERINAATTVYGEEELREMPVEQLQKLADALSSVSPKSPSANYAAATGGAEKEPATNTVRVEGLGELRPFNFED